MERVLIGNAARLCSGCGGRVEPDSIAAVSRQAGLWFVDYYHPDCAEEAEKERKENA